MSVWQPIETAPKDGTDILLVIPAYKRKVWIGSYRVSEHFSNGALDYRNEGWSIDGMLFGGKPEPEYWMPLPEFLENNERDDDVGLKNE